MLLTLINICDHIYCQPWSIHSFNLWFCVFFLKLLQRCLSNIESMIRILASLQNLFHKTHAPYTIWKITKFARKHSLTASRTIIICFWLFFLNITCHLVFSSLCFFLLTRNYGALRAPPLLALALRGYCRFHVYNGPCAKKKLVLADL